ncbi:MAG: hypothetical protein KKI08_20945, partial [Armatimonadetes bacterium]|nr:hypothetical protein [Armatimonadota bacterium]
MTEPQAAPAWGPLIRAELQPLLQRPLVWITVAFLLGIVWADVVIPPPLPVALIGVLAVLLTGFAVWRVPRAAPRLLLVCAFLVGGTLHAWRLEPGAAAQVPPEGVTLPQMTAVVAMAR